MPLIRQLASGDSIRVRISRATSMSEYMMRWSPNIFGRAIEWRVLEYHSLQDHRQRVKVINH